MAVYLFTSGTTWTVPSGITSIQVECYGSGIAYSLLSAYSYSISGGSYSKSNTVAVTPGATVYFQIGSNGGNTWFNTSNVAPTSSSSVSSACLAVGGDTTSASQIATNCGDVKNKGGGGYNSTPVRMFWGATGQGGQAGPNGNGADAGAAYNPYGVSSVYDFGTGGGANGGSQGGLSTIPYGRGGSGSSQGRGGYINTYNIGNPGFIPTKDIVGTSDYVNNVSSAQTYGPYGGGGGWIGASACCDTYYRTNGTAGAPNVSLMIGFVVITAVAAPVINVALTGSSSAASAGTLTNSQTLNQTLSGRSATASAGTVTALPSFTQALSGSLASASAGNLGKSNDQIVGLSSTSASASSGTLINSLLAVQALTGVSASGQTSSFPVILELVGAQASGATGSFDYRNTGWQPISTTGTSIWTDINTQQ